MGDWYYKNRERILADKRKQYKDDMTFREKKKEKTLDHYYKLKEECMTCYKTKWICIVN
jgi:hypothetical protein